MALLQHHDDSGTFHFDWLLAQQQDCEDIDARVVRTYRCGLRVDQAIPAGGIDLEQISDHRWFYLGLKKPHTLSRGRGIVTPLANGWWRGGEVVELRWDHDDVVRRYQITDLPVSRLVAVDPVR